MTANPKNEFSGVTLFEMLLVLVIMTSILLMALTYLTTKTEESKRDVATMQYEQLLNAGLAYYLNSASWPPSVGELQNQNYLPNKTIKNPWRSDYTFYSNYTTGTFSVCSVISGKNATIESGIMAGRLPMAYVANVSKDGTCPDATIAPAPEPCKAASCLLVSTVNIPGQNLNNARSVNFASVYHNGACVPAPACPLGMAPSILVAPVSVSGNYFGGSGVFPVSSFTAYAVGDAGGNPSLTPVQCVDQTKAQPCDATAANDGGLTTGTYWRVCLNIVTSVGSIDNKAPSVWDINSGSVIAFTRCIPTDEPVGSSFGVFRAD